MCPCHSGGYRFKSFCLARAPAGVVPTVALLSGPKPLPSPYNDHAQGTRVPRHWRLTRRHQSTSILSPWFALKQRIWKTPGGTFIMSLILNLQATESIGAQRTLHVRSHRATGQLTLSVVGSSRAAERQGGCTRSFEGVNASKCNHRGSGTTDGQSTTCAHMSGERVEIGNLRGIPYSEGAAQKPT